MEYIDLLDLQLQLREEIEGSFPERVWVRAEIASVQARANGHCYLDLSQSEEGRIVAKAKAVIWRSRYAPLRAYFREATGGDLAAGMEVLLRAQVSYSELYGLSLTVDEIEPRFTLGAAELQRRETLRKLEADGLLDKQQELEPALLPYRLAVISARDAAGYGDFRRHLEENAYGFVFEVALFEATMQGEDAPASIVDALERVECAPEPFDAVLILRGGGSALASPASTTTASASPSPTAPCRSTRPSATTAMSMSPTAWPTTPSRRPRPWRTASSKPSPPRTSASAPSATASGWPSRPTSPPWSSGSSRWASASAGRTRGACSPAATPSSRTPGAWW